MRKGKTLSLFPEFFLKNLVQKQPFQKAALTFSPAADIIRQQRPGQPRGGDSVRKVRASQSRIADNIGRGRPPDKCNRNKLPRPPGGEKVERWGKSPPVSRVTGASCKLYPKQHRLGGYGLLGQSPDGWQRDGQQCSPKIDGCRPQNPAYRAAAKSKRKRDAFRVSFSLSKKAAELQAFSY